MIAVAGAVAAGRGASSRLRRLVEDRPPEAQIPMARIVARQHDPGCMRLVRCLDDLLDQGSVPLPSLPRAATAKGTPLLQHVAAGTPALRNRLEPLLLLLVREDEHELEDQRSFAGEHPLEAGDRLEVAHQPGLVIRILGKAMDRVIVPGAEDDPSRALGRQIPPVAPHPGPRAFRLVRLAVAVRPHMAWVQPLVEALDHGTLARPVHAGHQDQDGELPLLRELQLRLQQLRPELWLLCPEAGLVEPVLQKCRLVQSPLPLLS